MPCHYKGRQRRAYYATHGWKRKTKTRYAPRSKNIRWRNAKTGRFTKRPKGKYRITHQKR